MLGKTIQELWTSGITLSTHCIYELGTRYLELCVEFKVAIPFLDRVELYVLCGVGMPLKTVLQHYIAAVWHTQISPGLDDLGGPRLENMVKGMKRKAKNHRENLLSITLEVIQTCGWYGSITLNPRTQ